MSAATNEHGIIFSGQMVRAIIDGRKSVTRRVVTLFGGPDLIAKARCLSGDLWRFEGHEQIQRPHLFDNDRTFLDRKCPYGVPGDRLWVRETWAAPHSFDGEPPRSLMLARIHYAATEERGGLLWRPSIFMPRWASRLTLEVVSVRVERLQEISAADAIAEGLVTWSDPPRVPTVHYGIEHADVWETDPCKAFARGWDTINGKRAPWASNPWVWRIEFRRDA